MITKFLSILGPDKKEYKDLLREKFVHKYDIFHTPEFMELFQETKSYAEAFYYENQNKYFLIPYLKKEINQSGFYDFETAYGYSGFLSTDMSTGFLTEAYNSFAKNCEQHKIVAGLMRSNPFLGNFYSSPEFKAEKKIVVLNTKCQKAETIFKHDFTSSVRNHIRKSEKNDVTCSWVQGEKALKDFQQLYELTMKRNEALQFYYFQDDFYQKLEKLLPQAYVILNAHKNGELMGSALLLFTKDIITYFLSSSNDTGLKLGVPSLLRYEAIKFSLEKNIPYINFGGGLTSSEEDSLFKFKKSFSKETANYYIGKLIFNRNVYNEICSAWAKDKPLEHVEKYNNYLLKYRY